MTSDILPLKIPTTVPNVYLRSARPTDHDAEGISKVFSHKYNVRFEPDRPGRSEPTPALYAGRIPKWAEAAEKGESCFCVVAIAPEDQASEDGIIGFGGFNSFPIRPAPQGEGEIKVADIGIMLHEPYTGKGYGIACMRATIEAAFEVFHADVIEAETLVINTPFRGLMKKLKLDQFSTVRSENGVEDVLYSFTKADWEKVK